MSRIGENKTIKAMYFSIIVFKKTTNNSLIINAIILDNKYLC